MQLKAFTFAALAGTALGQAMDLTSTLTSLPQLSNLTSFLGMFPDFAAQVGQLTNITLLAPNNAAFTKFLASPAGAGVATAPPALIQALLSYHVLNGTYQSFNGTQFVHTALMPGAYANVTGGQAVEAMAGDNGAVTFFSGLLQNSSVTGDAHNFTGGVIHIVDTVLTVPANISTTAVDLNLTSAAGALTAANLVGTVDSLTDVTVFVPNNEAFQRIGSALPGLTMEQVTAILTYHVINGTVGYSTLLENGTSLPTVQGGNVTITIEGGNVFVNSAQVVVPDVLVANGVVHVLNNVLNPMNATATPDGSDAGAFPGASSASDVPYTSGVPTPTSMVMTTGGATSPGGAAATSSSAMAPMVTGAVGAAALFGGAAILMNV